MAATPTYKARVTARAIRAATVMTLHQALVFDALAQLGVADAARWQRVFLSRASKLALGAAAPDADFRDFRNHLLFPDDGLWGGAAAKAQCWHRNLISALKKSEWDNAAYCAGVMAHYVIDAVHPFHTAQSDADNNASAALEHCVLLTYDSLRHGKERCRNRLPADWETRRSVADTVIAGASTARRSYDALVAHFDPVQAVADPLRGLDETGRSIMAGVLDTAVRLVALFLDWAIEEAVTAPPYIALDTSAAMRAVAAVPLAMFDRWRHRRHLRNVARQTVGEYIVTGHVHASAPPAVRVKRELYAREVLSRATSQTSTNVVFLQTSSGAEPVSRPVASVDGRVIPFRTHVRRESAVAPVRARRTETVRLKHDD